jgi:hypothetical protein
MDDYPSKAGQVQSSIFVGITEGGSLAMSAGAKTTIFRPSGINASHFWFLDFYGFVKKSD